MFTKKQLEEALRSKSKALIVYIDSAQNTRLYVVEDTKSIEFIDGAIQDTNNFNYTISISSITHVVENYKHLHPSVNLGSDPELFFIKDNEVVPSFNVLENDFPDVKKDGFQVELNPNTSHCREVAASYIAISLYNANQIARQKGVELSISVGHTISDDVWKKTPVNVKRFGCNPTENAQEPNHKRVTGLRERFRAGAGHIHLGLESKQTKDLPTLVKMLDIVAGNTMVILDRDEGNITRRKNYGRAGEYRVKPYGLEYRVLSNYWLRHYKLWSLASGLCRNAVGYNDAGLSEELISRYDMKKVRDAINNNDKELAIENLRILVDFVKEKNISTQSVFSFYNADKFFDWITSENPTATLNCDNLAGSLDSWEEKRRRYVSGFETFLKNI